MAEYDTCAVKAVSASLKALSGTESTRDTTSLGKYMQATCLEVQGDLLPGARWLQHRSQDEVP